MFIAQENSGVKTKTVKLKSKRSNERFDCFFHLFTPEYIKSGHFW